MPTGTLIILNGGSSAGKTSLGRAMRELLLNTYCWIDPSKRVTG